MTTRRSSRTKFPLALTAGLTALSLAACSASADEDGGAAPEVSEDQIAAALEEGGDLTWWTWVSWSEAQADAFMELHPNVTIEVVNVGTGGEEYTQIENALQAGSGAPDLAQIEYFAIPQFALSEGLHDLRALGLGGLEDQFTASTWGQVSLDDGVYGLPQDSGPIVMMYNAALFEEHGIEAPTTWDEYVSAAAALKEADPSIYITEEIGGPTSMPLIWANGGTPFAIDGTNISIDTADEGSVAWADTFNQLMDLDAVAPIAMWSQDWWTALGNGSIATILTGAWMPGIFEASLPEASGDWRVAPLPTADGSPMTGENGGSSMAITSQAENPELAAAFLEWLTTDEASIDLFLEGGGFPATTANIEDEEFIGEEWDFYGGQQVNQVGADASASVAEGWTFLPYQVHAYTLFGDTVSQAFVNKTDLNDGLAAWQEQLVTYGNQQGFSVNQ
ncbi:MAG: ABC transporter substrate-binding protein [Cumulibacter sp.]